MSVSFRARTALNGICPYFTMFPLEFPLSVLKHASEGEWVLDPFAGRGTTNYASRILGLPSIGIDSSPVAAALSWAKVVNATPDDISDSVEAILTEVVEPVEVPHGEFWDWAFHPDVLRLVCRLREGLLVDCASAARKALRAILLGALHGPRGKTIQSYFSNQCQRTYAPKPRYAVKYWQTHGLKPAPVDVLKIIRRRAERYYGHETMRANGFVIEGDSRNAELYANIDEPISWVITSPPYYGIRTYIPDQWLRVWFLGGPPYVPYTNNYQLDHTSQVDFIHQLRTVWRNAGSICLSGARLAIRFGSINDRRTDAQELIISSLEETSWTLESIVPAGTAVDGRRQALHFSHVSTQPCEEFDISARWSG